MHETIKASIVLLALLVATPAAAGSHRVKGYVRNDGTYVAPSRATNPNRTKVDNYSAKPHVTPSSGRKGTVDPYKPTTRRRK